MKNVHAFVIWEMSGILYILNQHFEKKNVKRIFKMAKDFLRRNFSFTKGSKLICVLSSSAIFGIIFFTRIFGNKVEISLHSWLANYQALFAVSDGYCQSVGWLPAFC
ncbi:hypothetical protein T4B_12871 [Trichinella pseudospiralis]|uniref:Uncharacterized protein n=1 Tax=Trichinella pseudospiralis TaxID=6337 RepID=A0A0V1I5M0_TRIPS|nr:hypothetical protein T4B_12871 [Trichinella pseudospiralis]